MNLHDVREALADAVRHFDYLQHAPNVPAEQYEREAIVEALGKVIMAADRARRQAVTEMSDAAEAAIASAPVRPAPTTAEQDFDGFTCCDNCPAPSDCTRNNACYLVPG